MKQLIKQINVFWGQRQGLQSWLCAAENHLSSFKKMDGLPLVKKVGDSFSPIDPVKTK